MLYTTISLSNSIYDQRPVSYGGSGYGGGSFLSEVPARTGAWRVCPKPGGPAQAGSHIACTTSYSCSHTVINPNTYPLQPHQCNPASTHPQKHPPKLTPVTVLTDTQTSKGHRIHTLTHPYIQPPTHTDAHPPIHPSIHPSTQNSLIRIHPNTFIHPHLPTHKPTHIDVVLEGIKHSLWRRGVAAVQVVHDGTIAWRQIKGWFR